MTVQGGMGDGLWIDGLDLSGDVGSLGNISCPLGVQDTTPINKYGHARTGLLHDGLIDFTAFWNTTAGADQAHEALSTLPTADRAVQYCRGTALGSPAASMIGKQINYDPTRGQDGSMLLQVNSVANGYGLEWGVLVSSGKQTDTAAGNGATLDTGIVSTAFGWAMYAQFFAFTGTSVTVKVQDSANGTVWADLSGATFVAASAVGSQRVSAGPTSTATVRRYLRVVTTGTFSNAVFGVNFVRYEAGGHQ